MTCEEFLNLARVLPEPLLLLSGEGEILGMNQPVANLLRLRCQELRGRMLFDLVTQPGEFMKLSNHYETSLDWMKLS